MSSVPVTGLRNLLHSQESPPWHTDPAMCSQRNSVPNRQYSIRPLAPFERESYFVQQYFQRDPPPGLGIKAIHVIYNAHMQAAFESKLPAMEEQAETMPSDWEQAGSLPERRTTLNRFEPYAREFSPFSHRSSDTVREYRRVHLLPLWHGTSAERADKIANSSLLYFGKSMAAGNGNAAQEATDDGFFGRGIYMTSSAEYAAKYASFHLEGRLLLCWAAFRDPFPLISDVPLSAPHVKPQPSDMTRYRGQVLASSHNAHYINLRKSMTGGSRIGI